MDLTAILGLVKPARGENYDVDIVNGNTQKIDDAIGEDRVRLTGLETFEEGSDIGFVNTGIMVAAAGWEITENKFITWGPVCVMKIVIKRTGAAIVSNTDGNIANVLMATWETGSEQYRPYLGEQIGIASSYGGPLFGAFIYSGGIQLNALNPGAAGNINTNDLLYGSATYIRTL